MISKLKTCVNQFKMGKKILTISVWVISVGCLLIAIASIIIIILAKFSEQSPIENHGSVVENGITQLQYKSSNCPRVSYFYTNPTEHTLYIRVIPDSLSVTGITLSLFMESINNKTFHDRLASCFAIPTSQCSIQVPKNVLFYAIVEADSNMDETVDTVLFRWECLYTTNVPLITGVIFLTVSMVILISTVTCVCSKVRIVKMLTKLVGILNESLNKEVNTPVQLTLDEMLYTEPIHQ